MKTIRIMLEKMSSTDFPYGILQKKMMKRVSLLAVRRSSTCVSKLSAAVADLPLREAVRYTTKNIKWTASDIKNKVDAHANAFLEFGVKKGDTLAIWLKESPEKHVTMLAAMEIGATVAELDPSLSDVKDIREALRSVACKVIVFDPVTETQDNLMLLRKSIPEFYHYDDSHCQSFHSKHFPTMKYFIQTGFDNEMGCLNYKSVFLPNPSENYVENSVRELSDDTPAYYKVVKGAKGIEKSAVATQGQLLNHEAWWFAKNLAESKYFESP